MAKVSEIIRQLQKVLPKYTDKFSDDFNISSLTVGAGIVTIKTSVAHKLSTNNKVLIKGVKTKNPIDSWSINADGYLEIVCTYEHDKTLGYPTTLTAELNFSNLTGEYTILDLPDNYTIVLDTAINPVGDGDLLEIRIDGYGGYKTITVPVGSTDTFTYVHSGLSVASDISQGKVTGNYRIAGIADVKRIFEYYEKQTADTKLWAWILLDKTKGCFTRESQTDATSRFSKLEDYQQELYQVFHIVVAVPSSNYTGAVEAVDMMQDVRTYLLKSLAGVMFPSGSTNEERFMCTYVEDSFYDYAGGYYLHDFVFENITLLSSSDICEEEDTRAFRESEINSAYEFDDYVDTVRKNIKTSL